MLLGALVEYFLDQSAITDLLGDRIYTTILPQGATTPAADLRVVTTRHEHHLGGLAGIATALVTVDCYSDTCTADGDELASAMMYSGIVGYRGLIAGVNIRGIRLDDGPRNGEESVDPGSDQRRFVTSFSLSVDYVVPC